MNEPWLILRAFGRGVLIPLFKWVSLGQAMRWVVRICFTLITLTICAIPTILFARYASHCYSQPLPAWAAPITAVLLIGGGAMAFAILCSVIDTYKEIEREELSRR